MRRTEDQLLSEIPKYDDVKTRIFQERRKYLGTEKNAEEGLKTIFLKEVFNMANNSSFLLNRLFSSLGKIVNIYLGRKFPSFSRIHIQNLSEAIRTVVWLRRCDYYK